MERNPNSTQSFELTPLVEPNQNEINYLPMRPRSTASRRLLSQFSQTTFQNTDFNVPQIAIIPGGNNLPPSRKREEAVAIENLKKRVSASQLNKNYYNKESSKTDKIDVEGNEQNHRENNRPQLLQRILISRPLSVVCEGGEGLTAWQDSDFITDSLCWHNVYRQRHGAPTLTMSPELCSFAQTWANHLAHTNKFYYRNDRQVGQNLFCRPVNSLQADVTGQEVSSYWYSAVRQYDYFKEPDVLHANVNAGHFTQLVWANTKYFGIGKARSRSGKILVVAHYAPPGNISGSFEQNVLPPGMEAPVPPPRYDLDGGSMATSSTDSRTTRSS